MVVNSRHHRVYSLFVLVLFMIMAPTKVHPERKLKSNSKVNQQDFNIPIATQAHIYASLDAQRPQKETKDGSGGGVIKQKLSRWFPQGLLWTPESDSDNEEDHVVVESSFVVDMPPMTSTQLYTSTAVPSFLDIIHSIQEGDRILDANFSDDTGESSADEEETFFGVGSGGDTKNNVNELSRRSRQRRRASANQQNAAPPTLTEICTGVPPPPEDFEEQLSCYSCESNVTNNNPKCDHRLFKYLRHSEKFLLRRHCSRGRNERYCMKRVHRSLGQRWTERGCVSSPILVLGRDGKGSSLENREGGCYTYRHGKFTTTTCFCKSNLCNAAPPTSSSSLFSMTVLGLSLFLYVTAFAFFHQN